MTDEKGGFYSAEDADSLDPDDFKGMTPDLTVHFEKKEGSFYLWRFDELNEILSKQEAEVFQSA